MIFLIGFVLAVSWNGSDVPYQGFEDNLYTHNLTNNITDPVPGMLFNVDTENTNLTWNGVKILYGNISSWMYIEDSSTGIFIINTTTDNQTGLFRIPFKLTSGEIISGVYFNFTVNATNDAPTFNLDANYTAEITGANVSYNLSLIGLDEEQHYPLVYNISFVNCELASWSSRVATNNCNLSYNLSLSSNTTHLLNFTSLTSDDIGIYNLSICVQDNWRGSALPAYRDSDYENNKTVCKDTQFYVERALAVEVSECTNKILQENSSFTCTINVTSRGQENSIQYWTNATLRNSDISIINSSWFLDYNSSSTYNFSFSKLINITPQKNEIGNWTINFTVQDITSGENRTETIYIFVNRTFNALPSIDSIPNRTTSVNLLNEIYFNVSDDDLLILDKGVYNETLAFSWSIFNLSNPVQELTLTDFSIVSSGSNLGVENNIFKSKLVFQPSSLEVGNYIIFINSTDKEGANSSTSFNLTVISNDFPAWQGVPAFNLTINSTRETTSSFYGNLTNSSWTIFANDSNEDALTFSNVSGAFPSFYLSSDGILNFTPYKKDVGFWNFSVTVSDGYLSSNIYFIFNITNINSEPFIEGLSAWNASANSSIPSISGLEDDLVTIFLDVFDEDSLINKSFYNETFIVSTSILNLTSGTINFSFGFYESYPEAPYENQTIYFAQFMPNKSNVGEYNITFNVTDASEANFSYTFNLNITELEHSPVISSVLNQTTTINKTFNYNFSVYDIEDGNSSLGDSFIFVLYDSLDKLDFNSSNFNSSSGILNMYFNSSDAGKHLVYLNVTDSSGLNSSTNFWLKIYDYPNITLPINGGIFNITENSTLTIDFAINHSVGDSLNYSFLLDFNSINISYGACNGTNRTFSFMPNFTQETYGDYKNMSLFVFNPIYPELNSTQNFYINISHTNYPIENHASISNQTGSSIITLNLKDYFRDYDAEDNRINQTIIFDVNLINLTSGSITYSLIDWINGTSPRAIFSASASASGIYSITAKEYNETNSSQQIRNVTSNNFSVVFTTNTVVVTNPSSGGGGGSSTTSSIKLIVSPSLIIEREGYFEFPFQIKNTGSNSLSNIDLSSLVDYELGSEVSLSLSKTKISSLSSGSSENLTLKLIANTKKTGKYLITLYANVSSPKISDWADISLNILDSQMGDAQERIIFTEKLLVDNSECLELNELLVDSKKLFDSGDYSASILRAQEAIDGCKKSILRNSQLKMAKNFYQNYSYFFIFILLIFFFFLLYIIFKRVRFKNKFPHYS